MARATERADVLLVARGLCESRSQAQALIMAGRVRHGAKLVAKAGERFTADVELVVDEPPRYVSRGGDKLHHALAAFGLEVRGRRCVDIGASTGGFTHCLLEHGAAEVYAVDVGYGQLHPRLRADPRVHVRERTNARYLTARDFDGAIDLVVVDASFISLDRLVGAIYDIVRPGGDLVALVKPQFEAGRAVARKSRGVIRDADARAEAIGAGLAAIERAGFEVVATADSALAGPKGNVEQFAHARRH
jgi:23S rRNA (cytidine1920-2'-O)/16S rRNA (cytidine1409-2'-O)-methyltransferase